MFSQMVEKSEGVGFPAAELRGKVEDRRCFCRHPIHPPDHLRGKLQHVLCQEGAREKLLRVCVNLRSIAIADFVEVDSKFCRI